MATAKRMSPNELLSGFALLIACQLAGEIGVGLLHAVWPALVFPGPVAGLIILLVLLSLRRTLAAHVATAADGLIGMLSLLFVPSAVGIIRHWAVIKAWGGPLLIAVIVSTVLTLLVTVGTYLLAERWIARKSP